MLSQALLAVRSTGDLGTACAIAGACAVHGLEAADFRVVRVDPRSGSLRCLEESGTETPYLAEPGGPLELGIQTESSTFDDGLTHPGPRESLLWIEPPAALAAIALQSGGLLRGFLLVGFPTPHRFTSIERLFLQGLGDALALAFEREALQRRMEDERQRRDALERRIRQGEEASSNLMSVVAHEIRTPLTAIKAYTEALLDNLSNEQAPRARFLGIINDECDRLTRLVTDVLDLSKLEAGQRPLRLSRFNLRTIIDETLEALVPTSVGKQIDVRVDVDQSVVPEADPDLMRRLLINLVGNAIKFSPPSTRVGIRAEGMGEEWIVSVEDEGPGIPDADLPHVFERFYRARNDGDPDVDGSGLGLAISRGIVELHGGRIWAEAREPRGSRFCFAMPIRQLASTSARRVARLVWNRADLRELFNHTVEMVSAAMNAEIVSLMLVDPDRGDLFIAASRGLEGQKLLGRRTTVRSGVAGTVAVSGRALLVNNIETDRRFRRLNHPQYKTKSLLCVPLRVEGEVLGVLNVNNKMTGDEFDEDDLAVLSVLVERIGSAVERACAHPESERLVREATEAVKSVTRLRREHLLGGQDIVRLARSVAREMSMSESDVNVIGYVASIHDVGMTRMPATMSMPVPLDDEHRRELSSHPEVSVEIMRPLEYLGSVRDLILCHHECWDGSGYPRGLRGEEIPLGSRILAVVDAYDSMTRGRPYRAARTHADAIDEMRQQSGRQFDPAAVEALERVLEREGTAT
jgi:signal transduction histidine kinase/HD-GYP domain-containing protein (c-di-GMP phosphodiesterase class II)